ncbi:MAG: DinB family protein [Planctomycetota bacterium]|jgi:uncharacterized damage-inducible protein DinB
MMSETKRVSRLLTRTSGGTGWYGPSPARLLADVSPTEAAASPLPGAHTIWQVVRHIIAWRDVARGLIEGGSDTKLPDQDNWPVVADTSESAWEATLVNLAESGDRLQESIARFPESRLDEPVPAYSEDGSSGITYYQLLHGVIHHDVYHAGQIAVLRNAQQCK